MSLSSWLVRESSSVLARLAASPSAVAARSASIKVAGKRTSGAPVGYLGGVGLLMLFLFPPLGLIILVAALILGVLRSRGTDDVSITIPGGGHGSAPTPPGPNTWVPPTDREWWEPPPK